MLVCYMHVALVVFWIWPVSDRTGHSLEYFTSLHMNLRMSSSEGMLMHELIPRTRDFLISSFLVYEYININKLLQNGKVE